MVGDLQEAGGGTSRSHKSPLPRGWEESAWPTLNHFIGVLRCFCTWTLGPRWEGNSCQTSGMMRTDPGSEVVISCGLESLLGLSLRGLLPKCLRPRIDDQTPWPWVLDSTGPWGLFTNILLLGSLQPALCLAGSISSGIF